MTPARLNGRGRSYLASRTWKACKEGGVIFNKVLKWSISNGERVNVWNDFWLASGPLRNLIHRPLAEGEGNLTVKDFLSNERTISFVLPELVVQEIRGIPLALNAAREDMLIWAFSKDGNFSINSAYLLAKYLNPLNLVTPKMWVWKSKTTPRIKFFLWLCYHGGIPTKAVLGSRGFNLETTCDLCGINSETIIHILCDCVVARNVWRQLGFDDVNQEFFTAPLAMWLRENCESSNIFARPWIP